MSFWFSFYVSLLDFKSLVDVMLFVPRELCSIMGLILKTINFRTHTKCQSYKQWQEESGILSPWLKPNLLNIWFQLSAFKTLIN